MQITMNVTMNASDVGMVGFRKVLDTLRPHLRLSNFELEADESSITKHEDEFLQRHSHFLEATQITMNASDLGMVGFRIL